MTALGLALQMLAVGMVAGPAAYVHFRGRIRHRLSRQLGDHSTFFAPFNVLSYAFSAVPLTPMLDVEALPELAPLRENWRTYEDIAFNTFFRRGWRRF